MLEGENNPSLEDYANQAIDLGVDGLLCIQDQITGMQPAKM